MRRFRTFYINIQKYVNYSTQTGLFEIDEHTPLMVSLLLFCLFSFRYACFCFVKFIKFISVESLLYCIITLVCCLFERYRRYWLKRQKETGESKGRYKCEVVRKKEIYSRDRERERLQWVPGEFLLIRDGRLYRFEEIALLF